MKNAHNALKVVFLFLFLFAGGLISCDNFIEVESPSNQLIRSTVFENDITATATILALYSQMSGAGAGFNNLSFTAGASADELIVTSSDIDRQEFYQNSLRSTNPNLTAFWNTNYKHIYYANSIIEGLAQSKSVSADLRQQLVGEALFIRAFSHFYLVNLFSDVPYITTTDYEKNSIARKNSTEEVYSLIIQDLINAKELLSEDYSYSANQRIRVNKFAAGAMLARVYLYAGNWSKAEESSNEVISKTDFFILGTDLNAVFLTNSKEAIWQLQSSNQNYTNEGNIFLSVSGLSASKLSNDLLGLFTVDDKRRSNWIKHVTVNSEGRYVPNKYKDTNTSTTLKEASIVLRLAEQYLIRAEARANQNKLVDAESDLNTIRTRAGLALIQAISKEQMLAAILVERRLELFTEWGHRWLDLKRTGKANDELRTVKPGWDSFDIFYPIPNYETLVNPNMVQNDGY